MNLSILRWSILGFLAALILMPSVARASDCPPDDPSRSDCKGAATTARNPLVPIAGAVAGSVAGWVAGQVLKPAATKEPPVKEEDEIFRKDPCHDDLQRLNQASFNARILQAAREHLQNMLNLLETQYENTRQASYLSGVIDAGFIGGSLWTKPLAGFLGRTLASQTLKQKLVEAALKALGKEITKSLVKTMYEQGIKWESFLEKPLEGAMKKGFQEALKDDILHEQMQKFIQQGIDPKGPVGKALQEGIKTELAGPLSDAVGNFISIVSMGTGAFSGAEKLKAIRDQMSEVRQKLYDVDSKLEDAISEMSLARSALQHCRKIWPEYNPWQP